MFFIVLVVFAGAALGQYPNIIYDTSISLNMCASDADCEIYSAERVVSQPRPALQPGNVAVRDSTTATPSARV